MRSLIFTAACRLFRCSRWDLGPWSGIEPGLPALGAWSLSHWTTRVVPKFSVLCTLSIYIEKEIPRRVSIFNGHCVTSPCPMNKLRETIRIYKDYSEHSKCPSENKNIQFNIFPKSKCQNYKNWLFWHPRLLLAQAISQGSWVLSPFLAYLTRISSGQNFEIGQACVWWFCSFSESLIFLNISSYFFQTTGYLLFFSWHPHYILEWIYSMWFFSTRLNMPF